MPSSSIRPLELDTMAWMYLGAPDHQPASSLDPINRDPHAGHLASRSRQHGMAGTASLGTCLPIGYTLSGSVAHYTRIIDGKSTRDSLRNHKSHGAG